MQQNSTLLKNDTSSLIKPYTFTNCDQKYSAITAGGGVGICRTPQLHLCTGNCTCTVDQLSDVSTAEPDMLTATLTKVSRHHLPDRYHSLFVPDGMHNGTDMDLHNNTEDQSTYDLDDSDSAIGSEDSFYWHTYATELSTPMNDVCTGGRIVCTGVDTTGTIKNDDIKGCGTSTEKSLFGNVASTVSNSAVDNSISSAATLNMAVDRQRYINCSEAPSDMISNDMIGNDLSNDIIAAKGVFTDTCTEDERTPMRPHEYSNLEDQLTGPARRQPPTLVHYGCQEREYELNSVDGSPHNILLPSKGGHFGHHSSVCTDGTGNDVPPGHIAEGTTYVHRDRKVTEDDCAGLDVLCRYSTTTTTTSTTTATAYSNDACTADVDCTVEIDSNYRNATPIESKVNLYGATSLTEHFGKNDKIRDIAPLCTCKDGSSDGSNGEDNENHCTRLKGVYVKKDTGKKGKISCTGTSNASSSSSVCTTGKKGKISCTGTSNASSSSSVCTTGKNVSINMPVYDNYEDSQQSLSNGLMGLCSRTIKYIFEFASSAASREGSYAARIPRRSTDFYRVCTGIQKSIRTAGIQLLLILTTIMVYIRESVFAFFIAVKSYLFQSDRERYGGHRSLGRQLQTTLHTSNELKRPIEVRVRAVLYGLARTGRTSLLLRMKLGDFLPTLPTVSTYCERFSVPVGAPGKSASFDIWDCDRKDYSWRAHRTATDAIIFVIDSCQKRQITEARDELLEFMFEESYNQTSTRFAILANKQDVHGALKPSEIQTMLSLPTQLRARWRIFGTSAVTGNGVDEVAEWLALTADNGSTLLIGHEMSSMRLKIAAVDEMSGDCNDETTAVDHDGSSRMNAVTTITTATAATANSNMPDSGGTGRHNDNRNICATASSTSGTSNSIGGYGLCENPQRHWRRTLSQLSSSSSHGHHTAAATTTASTSTADVNSAHVFERAPTTATSLRNQDVVDTPIMMQANASAVFNADHTANRTTISSSTINNSKESTCTTTPYMYHNRSTQQTAHLLKSSRKKGTHLATSRDGFDNNNYNGYNDRNNNKGIYELSETINTRGHRSPNHINDDATVSGVGLRNSSSRSSKRHQH
eukprot:Lankesteria_metandrocarpae@DN4227_c1_g1_i1.p1